MDYQQWRGELVQSVMAQINGLNDDLIEVRQRRQYVDKYKNAEVFSCLGETAKSELLHNVAPLVHIAD